MNLVRATRHAIERRMSISDLDSVMDMIAGGGAPTYTGKLVSPRNVLQISAAWSCVNVLSDDFATLPFPTYRWRDGQAGEARDEARDHYLWPLFMEEANPWMASNRFKRVMECWRQLWGNAYAYIEMNGRGQITALYPIRPDRMKVFPLFDGPSDVRGRVVYLYYPLQNNTQPIPFPSDRILHIRGTSLDGIVGLSPVEVHRQTFGLSLAMTEHAGRFYGNGAVVKGIFTYPGKINPKSENSIREMLKQYSGLSNSHKMMILEEGMDYKDIGMKMEDAQFIESMDWSVNDIARIYKVPSHRINSLDKQNNSIVEQLAMEYVQNTLGPNADNWCGEIHSSLLSNRDRANVFIEPDYSYMLRADHAARAQYIQAVTTAGAFAPDDVRKMEGKNPLPKGIGKIPRVNSATVPLGSEMASGTRPTPATQTVKTEPATGDSSSGDGKDGKTATKDGKKKASNGHAALHELNLTTEDDFPTSHI